MQGKLEIKWFLFGNNTLKGFSNIDTAQVIYLKNKLHLFKSTYISIFFSMMKLFNWRDKTGSNMSFCLPGLFLGNILTPASRLGGGGQI